MDQAIGLLWRANRPSLWVRRKCNFWWARRRCRSSAASCRRERPSWPCYPDPSAWFPPRACLKSRTVPLAFLFWGFQPNPTGCAAGWKPAGRQAGRGVIGSGGHVGGCGAELRGEVTDGRQPVPTIVGRVRAAAWPHPSCGARSGDFHGSEASADLCHHGFSGEEREPDALLGLTVARATRIRLHGSRPEPV